jgi:hypothetical protein
MSNFNIFDQLDSLILSSHLFNPHKVLILLKITGMFEPYTDSSELCAHMTTETVNIESTGRAISSSRRAKFTLLEQSLHSNIGAKFKIPFEESFRTSNPKI